MPDLVEILARRDVEARLVFFVAEEMKGRGLELRDGAVYGVSDKFYGHIRLGIWLINAFTIEDFFR